MSKQTMKVMVKTKRDKVTYRMCAKEIGMCKMRKRMHMCKGPLRRMLRQ